jgi:hypothetical protein
MIIMYKVKGELIEKEKNANFHAHDMECQKLHYTQ